MLITMRSQPKYFDVVLCSLLFLLLLLFYWYCCFTVIVLLFSLGPKLNTKIGLHTTTSTTTHHHPQGTFRTAISQLLLTRF